MGKPIWGKWANNYDVAQLQVKISPWNFKWGIHPAVSEIGVLLVWTQLDKFLAHGQAYKGQMGKWPWQCTTTNATGPDNSTELRMEKIGQAITDIWVPQVWQPTPRPPGPWRQYPSSPEGWGVKSNHYKILYITQQDLESWNVQKMLRYDNQKRKNCSKMKGPLKALGQDICILKLAHGFIFTMLFTKCFGIWQKSKLPNRHLSNVMDV